MSFDRYISLLIDSLNRLKMEVKFWKKRSQELECEVAELKKVIAAKNIKKNSNNSSLPPSTDIVKRNQSLRQKSEKKRGGQPGHDGHTLQMSSTPDVIVELDVPHYCNICGNDLSNIPHYTQSYRQVIDIPRIEPICTEYRQTARQCTCGHIQTSQYPAGVNTGIQYGPNIQAIVCYESVRQYTPYNRLCEKLEAEFNLHLSAGTIRNILDSAASKAQPVVEQLTQMLANSKQAVGADETSLNVGGKKFWAWIYQNVYITIISIQKSRGKSVIDALFSEGFKNATLVSDRWRAHISTYALHHQLCIAHLLRECNYLQALEKTEWIANLKTLFCDAIEMKRQQTQYDLSDIKAQEIETRFTHLLSESLDPQKAIKTSVLQRELNKHRQHIFTFLYYADVPPDNNASERGVRNIKIKEKVSGQFNGGQDDYAILRSIVDTAIKNACNVFEVLALIAKLPKSENLVGAE